MATRADTMNLNQTKKRQTRKRLPPNPSKQERVEKKDLWAEAAWEKTQGPKGLLTMALGSSSQEDGCHRTMSETVQ